MCIADQEQFCEYLSTVFKAQLKDDPTAVVLHDVRWQTPSARGARFTGRIIGLVAGNGRV